MIIALSLMLIPLLDHAGKIKNHPALHAVMDMAAERLMLV